MPWNVVRDTNACSMSKPWAVKNKDTGDVRGRCHATKSQAVAQQKALYAAYRREGKLAEYFLAPVEKLFGDTPLTGEPNVTWVQALPYDSWEHPLYGTTTVTPEIAQEYVKNFKENIRGQDIAIGYNHGYDAAKGEKAAGWVRDMEARSDGLFFKVEFTPTAVDELKNGEWRYFSSEIYDEWEHPHTGKTHQYVVSGGSLTNKPWVKGMLPINFSEVMESMQNEVKELEHSEPGTGAPPAPREDGDGSNEPDREGGWRRDTPPIAVEPVVEASKGGNQMEFVFAEKDARELFKALDLDSDSAPDRVVETIKIKFGELNRLRETVDAVDQEKIFAEQYPQYWNEHRKLMERDRVNTARVFSESVSKIRDQQGYGLVETKRGLSTIALEKVTETHKKFSEGTATIEDFEECIKNIVNGGIVQFGEIGNGSEDALPDIDTGTAGGIAGARRLFAEVINKVQTQNPEWDYMKCVEEAGKKHPDLADAYRVTLPA